MKYAVELFFDPITDASVRAAWGAIQAATGISYMQANGARSRISYRSLLRIRSKADALG